MTNYFAATRHPWPCLVLLIPLIALYEVGVVMLTGPDRPFQRNGADVWLRDAIQYFGTQQVFAAPGLIIALFLGLTFWRWSDRPSHVVGIVFGMCLESLAFAGVLWMVGRNFSAILGHLGVPLALQSDISTERLAAMVTFVGAGVYEEVVFRLILFAGLVRVLHAAVLPGFLAIPTAMAATALLFALAHVVGPSGQRLEEFRADWFLFRTTCGVFFAALYWYRGFGVAVGTHALYDVLTGLPPA